MVLVAKVVSSGASDSAQAISWPPSGTVDRRPLPGLGHVAVRYASWISPGTIDSLYFSSVASWPTKISGIDMGTGRPSRSVATTPKQNGLPFTYGQNASSGRDPFTAWFSGGS